MRSDHEAARRHPLRRLLLFALVLVLGGCGWIAWQWRARGPEEASVSDALSKFRASNPAAAAVADDTTTTGAQRDPIAFVPGVYEYRGSGEEQLSFLGTSQPQGPVLPATVLPAEGGCSTFSIAYNSFHSQGWTWCPTPHGFTERGGTVAQKFDFGAFKMDERSTSVCRPAFVMVDRRDEPGARHRVDCTTESQTTEAGNRSAGTSTFVGREAVAVGDVTVEALHYRIVRTVSGGQQGSDRIDVWFDAARGLPVRQRHDLRVVSPAPPPLDEVTYTERGEWQLTSLTPKT